MKFRNLANRKRKYRFFHLTTKRIKPSGWSQTPVKIVRNLLRFNSNGSRTRITLIQSFQRAPDLSSHWKTIYQILYSRFQIITRKTETLRHKTYPAKFNRVTIVQGSCHALFVSASTLRLHQGNSGIGRCWNHHYINACLIKICLTARYAAKAMNNLTHLSPIQSSLRITRRAQKKRPSTTAFRIPKVQQVSI